MLILDAFDLAFDISIVPDDIVLWAMLWAMILLVLCTFLHVCFFFKTKFLFLMQFFLELA